MKTIKNLFLFIPCLLIFITSAMAGEEVHKPLQESTVDGRYGTKCFRYGQRPDGISENICDISFYRLIAQPEVYDSKLISITGYLISDFGNLILFPSKYSYLGNVDVDGVVLTRPFSISRKLLNEAKSGIYPVLIIGYFDAHYHESVLPPRLGSMYDIKSIMYSPRIPSGTETDTHGIRILEEP